MNLFSLLFVLCLLINSSECGPEIFKFTSQPASQTVNSGGSVTLQCVATGRTGITYSWYKLDTGFTPPPSELNDLISGANTEQYVVLAADVDGSKEKNLFQCKATAVDNVILSNVATVKYSLEDDIKFNGASYTQSFSTSVDATEADMFVYKLSCNKNEGKLDAVIVNGKLFDVYWFKDTETNRVENTHTNMWTYYNDGSQDTTSVKLSVDVADNPDYAKVDNFKPYDLVIFNAQTSDSGKYYCKAVSRGDGNSELLGTSTLTVTAQLNDHRIKSEDIVGGFIVLAVDDTGQRKSTPNVGDEVLLMCGAACRTAGGSWDIQYTWKKDGTVIPNTTNTITVTATSVGDSAKYSCEINSACGSPSAKSITFYVKAAEFNPLLKFTFSKSPPEYMWYDISDNTKSDDPFVIDCDGSVSSGSVSFIKAVYKNGTSVSSSPPYTFDSDIKSERSGVYQCALNNDPSKVTWYQKTTNVIIAIDPTTTITPTSLSIQHGTTATFTCTVGGYPIETVTISGPNSVNLICPQTSGAATCSSTSTDNTNYKVTVVGFSLTNSGQYTCTVQTRWYKNDGTGMGKPKSDRITLTYVKDSTTQLTASKNPADKGDPVTLTCVVEGYPAPSQPTLTKSGSTVDWTTCTGANPNRKECTKTFSSATYTDSGDYKCEGSNTIDNVNKPSHDDLSLTIVGDVEVTLTQNPVGTELGKGSSVTFTCKAKGYLRPTKLTFKKGDKSLKSYDSAGSADRGILITTYDISYVHNISSLALDDTAVYTCEGENNNGGTKKSDDTKTITVVSDVAVTITASSKTPTVGSSFTIACTATGGRKPHSVELKRDSTSIKSYPTDTGFCTSTDSYSLKCTYTTTADYTSGGTYKCIGKNRVANSNVVTTTEPIGISVSQAVKVTMTPASETEVPTGTSFTITCHVEGGNKPHKVTLTKPDSGVLTWLPDSSGSSTLLSCSGTFVLTCNYVISSPAYADEGQYRCDGYNKLPGQTNDQTESATVSLVLVKNVDVILTKSTTSNLNEVDFGDPFTITCVADGGRIPFYLKFDRTAPSSSTATQIVLYNEPSSTPNEVTVNGGANTLTYVHSVTESSYNDDGTYKCTSKNRAASSTEQDDVQSQKILVVKNVTSSISTLGIVNKGSPLTITCSAEGNRPPHYVALGKDGVSMKKWNNPATECTVSTYYKFECVYDVSSTDYPNGGKYMCVSKNKALGDKEVSSSDNQTTQISQSVLTVLTPNSVTELEWGSQSLILTCNIEGGLQPHKATLEVPGGTTLAWIRGSSGVSNSFTCNGDHEVECVHEITSTNFDNTGHYNCTGYNKLPNSSTDKETKQSVEVIVVKDVQASLTSSSGSDEVDFETVLSLTCKVEGGRAPFYLLFQFTGGAGVVSEIIKYDGSKQQGTITQNKNSLEYVHVIRNVTYNSNGSYKCTGKNKALGKEVKTDESSKNAVVVKNVEITQSSDIEADYGSSFTFTIKLNGGRTPHLVTLTNGNSQIFNWEDDGDVCTGTNELICTKIIGDSDVNFGYDGTYTVTAKNKARDNVVKTATKDFNVTVYKDVWANIIPSSDSDITYHIHKTITCKVIGGLPPHQVDLILPNQGTKTWKRDGSETSLTCSGEHERICEYTFTPEYDSDGGYKCKGYNEGRNVTKMMESPVVKLTTKRSTEVTVISNDTMSVLTNGTIEVDCIIVGKPLVEKSSVTWKHDNDSLDLSGFVNTAKGTEDDFTLKSTLNMTDLKTEYAGNFSCSVQDGDETISKSVEVFINNEEFLASPTVTYTGGEFIEEGGQISVTCRVEGFPAPSAILTYENEDGTLSNTTNPESTVRSTISTEFVFSFTTTCNYLKYKFSCNTQTQTSRQLLKKSTAAEGPSITGCENPLPVIIGGGVGSGVVFIVIIVVAVVCILKRLRGNKNGSYTPENGTQIPSKSGAERVAQGSRNPAFSPDPNYATVRDNQGVEGYSHLNRPAGETSEDDYACINQMKPSAVPPLGNDAYATLDTTSNGRLGHKRAGSDEAYAALNRPAPGKEKRGVIRKYKPISNKPKNTFGVPPSKPIAGDIEMGETSHGSKPEPTYATVNPETLKSKAKASDYADVTLPDPPPEVPIYGQMSGRQPITSEYADVTIPDFLPEIPLYSNMSNRQGSAPAEEDPVYAQVDLKSRSMKTQPTVEDDEEFPPDVPVYGTMGELTEPYHPPPDEEEDPYATVEFVPKSKRKPPRPKLAESTSEGVYATITDFKESP